MLNETQTVKLLATRWCVLEGYLASFGYGPEVIKHADGKLTLTREAVVEGKTYVLSGVIQPESIVFAALEDKANKRGYPMAFESLRDFAGWFCSFGQITTFHAADAIYGGDKPEYEGGRMPRTLYY